MTLSTVRSAGWNSFWHKKVSTNGIIVLREKHGSLGEMDRERAVFLLEKIGNPYYNDSRNTEEWEATVSWTGRRDADGVI